MKYFVVVACLVAVAVALPFEIIENEDGEQYYAVPLSRERRQISQNEEKHRLEGSVSATKSWDSSGLDQVSGRLEYAHKPSRTGAFVGADHDRRLGTNVNAGMKYNIYESKNWGVDLTGQYGRHFGGPYGTGRPNAGAFLNVHGRF